MSLMRNVARFARSPQGRKMLDEAKRMSKDPETRRKLEGFRAQMAKRKAR